MKQIIEKFTKLAEKDREVLKGLKNLAVQTRNYELAANLRTLEVEKYPEALTTSKEYKNAEVFDVVLRLVDMNIGIERAYLVLECAKVFIKKKGNADMKDTAKIKSKAKKIFG